MDLIKIHFPLIFIQVNSRMSKEEILNLLARKSDQVNRLEEKIAGELHYCNCNFQRSLRIF